MESTRPKRTLQEKVEIITDKVIKDFYFGKERISIKTVHELICNEIKMVNETKKLSYDLACPSYSAVYSRVKNAEKSIEINQKNNIANEKVKKVQYPRRALQRVEVFSGQLELDTVEDETKEFLGKPWITIPVDCYTRNILRLDTGFHPPTYVSVMNALLHAISPKNVRAKYLKIRSDWIAYGVP